MQVKVAVGSSDGYTVDEHFGRCSRFLIYEISDAGEYAFIESRVVVPDRTQEGHEPNRLRTMAEELSDCGCVLAAQIGRGAIGALSQFGVTALAVEAPIDKALNRLTRFLQSNRGSILARE
ncbi:hypothetical protein PSTEL_15960 [Paenibacillus stellifer]|uniref:Dinitrogenase iron-molybdenum cofactor biosynthesis domain-containing protein n=1 Tax=Paenibacillus stellifer TaxID=169760 RepID=A0A089LTZ2_9BACL|nr:hypothetical protein PSTEL_15960 [Paenibacillus stellifer]